jgi:hypothetical protein
VRRPALSAGAVSLPRVRTGVRHCSLLPLSKPLPPFPMCRALPGSEYYGGSAPSRAGRPTAGPARIRALAARDRADRDGSRVHCDSLDEGGAQLYPCGIAATPQHFAVASRQTSTCPPGSSPFRHEGNGCAPLPAHIRQVGAGEPLRDVMTLVPRVLLSVTLAGPAPSGSTNASRLCRGCSRHPRRFPDQAAPSFATLLRQG